MNAKTETKTTMYKWTACNPYNYLNGVVEARTLLGAVRAGREECLVYAGVRSYIILTRRARRSCRLFGIPSAERSCVNCAYVDLLHYQPPCNNCLRSPYAVHGETTDDAWKPIGKWQNPYKRA